MHDEGVLDVAVGEHHLVDVPLAADVGEIRFIENGNSVGVASAGERGRIAPTGDARDLGGGEGHDLAGGVVAKDDVEVVEVAAGRAHDEHASRLACICHAMPPYVLGVIGRGSSPDTA